MVGGTVQFETEAAAALRDLQRALRALVDAIPGLPSSGPELVRALRIDRNLAWKAHRLVQCPDPAAAAPFVPGRGAMVRFIDAAREAGADPTLATGASESFDRYIGVIERHAGDRASAELMLSAGAGGRRDGAELGMRRAAFRAAGYLAGLRVRTHLASFIAAPGSDANRVDIVAIKGFYDIERIRPSAPFVMSRPRAAVGGDIYATVMPYQPIEPPPEGCELPLLAEFCSRPLPRFEAFEGEEGFIEDELEDRPIGRTGACSIVRATVSRNLLPKYKSEGDEFAEVSARVRVPCETLVLDKFVHKEAYGAVNPWVRIYNDLAGETAWLRERRERYLVPWGGEIEHLGSGLDAVRTSEVPRYDAMMAHVFDRLGWNAGEFEVFRVRLELPLVPSTAMMIHPQADG